MGVPLPGAAPRRRHGAGGSFNGRASGSPPRIPEKVVQAQLIKLYVSVGAKPYVIGTTRKKPPKGIVLRTREEQREWYSTRQTPGIADLLFVLPAPPREHAPEAIRNTNRLAVWHEAKASDGRMSAEQKEFRELMLACGIAHVVGGYDAAIAFLMDRGYLKRGGVPHYRLPAQAQET